MFNALASSDQLRMDFYLQPGDIQLLNNLTQQHRRSSFAVGLASRRESTQLLLGVPVEQSLGTSRTSICCSDKVVRRFLREQPRRPRGCLLTLLKHVSATATILSQHPIYHSHRSVFFFFFFILVWKVSKSLEPR